MGKSLITFWGSEHQTTLSGAEVGLTEVTTRSAILRGNFSASLREVSSMNCNMKLLRPMDASRSKRSELSNRSGSAGDQESELLFFVSLDDTLVSF